MAVWLDWSKAEQISDCTVNSGGFLLSAAEQFLKHELTKNFKVRCELVDGLSHWIIFHRLFGTSS